MFQYSAFFGVVARILRHKPVRADSEPLGKFLYVPIGDLDGGDAAAVCAGRAIDLLLDILGDAFQTPLLKVPPLQVKAQPEVFIALFFAQAAYLH
jgi:hypothetical protein